MLASRITVSVVALGTEQDKDTAFLRELATQGGGRFYLTADAATLPRLFTIETMRAAESSLREDAFLPHAAVGARQSEGIDWQEAPLLLGLQYLVAEARRRTAFCPRKEAIPSWLTGVTGLGMSPPLPATRKPAGLRNGSAGRATANSGDKLRGCSFVRQSETISWQ